MASRRGRRGDAAAVAAFLEAAHLALPVRLTAFRDRHLGSPDPDDDATARTTARAHLGRLADAGLLALADGQDLRALCLAREALAWASPLADSVLAVQALAATAARLARESTDEAHEPLDAALDALRYGRAMGAFAMSEPGAGSDVAAMRTTAVREGDVWVLDGEKHLISNAGIADIYVTFAVTTPGAGSRGISAFLVPASAPGLGVVVQQTASAHPLGRVRFSGCRIPAQALLGGVGGGFRLGMATLDRLRTTVGASACGMAARALETVLDHASTHPHGGGVLGDLGVVRDKLGRMAAELDAARLLVYRAAWLGDRGGQRITVEASMAKSFATEAAQRIVDDALQIAGGVGVLTGHPLERLVRAVRAARIYEGATEVQHAIIAGAMLDPRAD